MVLNGTSTDMLPPPPGDAECIDTGDTTWVMMATILVLGMMPGLAFFEAGLLRKKNTLSLVTQIFTGLSIMAVMWHLFGFSLVYGPDHGGVIGDFTYALFLNLNNMCLADFAPRIPGTAFALFQMMFAAITPLLMTGAFAERMRFKTFLVFIILWEVIIYYPLAHWIWGNGWLADWGVLDFAGGIVIHTSSGASCLVIAMVMGKRAQFDKHHGEVPASNIPLAAIGAAMLWMGWYGFNAGSALKAGNLSSATVSNTMVASAVSVVVWMICSTIRNGRVDTISVLNGAIAGLAGITPASGFIQTYFAGVTAVFIGLASYFSIILFKHKMKLDDALDVSSVHGVTGVVGALAIGFFADQEVNPAFGNDGLLKGNPKQLGLQALGVCVAIAWSWFFTWVILKILDCTMGLKVTEAEEILGLDLAEHGLSAYHGEHHGQIHDHHEDSETKPINEHDKDHYNSIGDHPHSF